MHLIDGQSALPGADLVSRESTGEVLTVADGDEPADWQQAPVTVDFGLAWRQHEQWDLGPEQAAPDFVNLPPRDPHHPLLG